jgi:ABC-2 type transport system permease protein
VKPWLSFVTSTMRGEWAFMRREKSVLLMLLFVPLGYPLIMSWLYSRDQAVERPALVVDADNSALSRRLTLELDATQEVRVVRRPASLDEGLAAMRAREADLLVFVPEDFSRKVKKGEPAAVRVWADSGNMYTYSVAFPAAFGVVSSLNGRLAWRGLRQKGLSAAAASARAQPVLRAEHLLFHPTGSYGRYLMAGVLLIVIQQIVVISLSFSVGARREQGLFDPGPYPVGYLAGIIGAHVPFYLAGILFAVLGVTPAFGWTAASPVATVALFTLFMVTLVPVAVGVASFARDRMGTFQLFMFFSVPLFVASGFTWPADQMPAYLRVVTAVFPATPALQALRIVALKAGGLGAVAPYLAWLAVQFVVYAVLAVVVARRAWTYLPGFPWGLKLPASLAVDLRRRVN